MGRSLSIALLLIAGAPLACAGPGSETRWDDPVVYGLRLVVAPEPLVKSSELLSSATRLRTIVEQTMRSRGFKPPDGKFQPDGLVRLWLERATPERYEAGLLLRMPSGAELDEIKVVRREPLPETQLQFESLAQELVVKFERSARVQTLAHTGVITTPP